MQEEEGTKENENEGKGRRLIGKEGKKIKTKKGGKED